MNERREKRELAGLTQTDAAASAGVSLATWRRWEEDPESVRSTTRDACEAVLHATNHARESNLQFEAFERAWGDCYYLTPRQAYAIASTLDVWADADITEWLEHPGSQPLHEVSPFDQLDLRVMMHVNESRAWAAKVAERCYAVADEIAEGVLPFDRPGVYADELLIALALRDAKDSMADLPELFEEIQSRPDSDDAVGDDDWDAVSDAFDDRCRWDEWEVPLYRGHVLLPAILAERHPFTWFDSVPATGAGYLNRLIGIERLEAEGQESADGAGQ